MVRDRAGVGGSFGAVTKGRMFVLVVALMLVAAACGNSGAPISYEDNPAEYRGVPNVGQAERNFRDGCEQAGLDDLDERVTQNLADVCKCGYDRIKQELTFDEFKELDDDLRSNINADLTETVRAIMRQCILEESGV